MPHPELDRLEGDVREARRRLKSDLEALRAPETFSSFKEDVIGEARQSRDDIVANVKEAAANRAERLVADIKARAAANPVAVGAIAAGVAWRILRKPPITTMLVGYGLISLWRTKPGQPAPGAETVYRAADMVIEAKEQAEQWGSEAGDVIARHRGRRSSCNRDSPTLERRRGRGGFTSNHLSAIAGGERLTKPRTHCDG